MIIKLCAPGLYVAQRIGEVSIPDSSGILKDLRKKCMPRIMYMKVKPISHRSISGMLNKAIEASLKECPLAGTACQEGKQS